MNYQPAKVLVTGGAGFIGSNFVRCLLANDPTIQVVNLDLLTYAGSVANLDHLVDTNRHHFIQGDITNLELVETILQDYHIDTIVHFAAESHVDRSIQSPMPFIQTNLVGTFALLEAARHVWLQQKNWDATHCRFHHISTDEVYGSLSREAPAFTEQSLYAPNSPYSASKAGSDHLVRAYFHTYQLPVTMSHCSNNYGPYQHPEKLIPTIINAYLDKKRIPIYGDGSNIRDWIFVTDHCLGILAILKQGRLGEAYHLGGQCELSNLQVAHHICLLMDELYPGPCSYQELIQFVTDRPGHDWRYAIDITKVQQELNWGPAECFATGIRKTIDFYLSKVKEVSHESY
jgi:dTDP-glucose 4,6-dehydratase